MKGSIGLSSRGLRGQVTTAVGVLGSGYIQKNGKGRRV